MTIFDSLCYEISFLITLYFCFSTVQLIESKFVFSSQVKEAMQRIHDRGNIGKLILDVEKAPTPLVITAFTYLIVGMK